jgi:Ca-activated chloride channel family protein
MAFALSSEHTTTEQTMRWIELNRTPLLWALAVSPAVAACGVVDEEAQSDESAYSPYSEQAPGPPVVDQSGENYAAVHVNAFVDSEADPLATFAVDVDTGSYTLMRRDVLQGHLPVPGGVRVEEYVNFFKYADPAPPPQSDDPFAIHLEAAPSPFGEGLHLLRVHLAGKAVDASERPRANLVFLVDVSGSMAASGKLDLVQHALTRLTEALRPDDTVGLVVYAGEVGTALEPTPVSRKGAILEAIQGLGAGGSTNGEGGIRAAYALAGDTFIEGGINRVFLCTDGDFNVGLTGDALVDLIEDERDRGITLTTLGFGSGNYNDRDMEALADHGNGNYFYIDSTDEAERALVRDLGATLQVIAKDAKVQVTFDPEVVRRWRLVGYENRDVADRDFDNDRVDGGEIGAGHRVTAFFELDLRPGAHEVGNDTPLASVSVRAKAPDGQRSTETRAQLPTSALQDHIDSATTDFRFGAAVAEFAEVLRGSPYAEAPTRSLSGLERLAHDASAGDAEREEFVDLVERVRGLWSR